MKIIKDFEQGSDLWLQARAGRISGTKLASVMAGDKAVKTLQFELLGEIYAPLEEEYKSPAMERGNYLEPFAIERFEKEYGRKVTQVGLVEKDDFSICSPDGLCYNQEGIIDHAVEIKCLSAKKMLRYMLCENAKDIYSIEKSYYWQIVNYFLVIDTLESISFTLYHPGMYDIEKQLFILNITREELQKDIDKAKAKTDAFKETFLELKKKLGNQNFLQQK